MTEYFCRQPDCSSQVDVAALPPAQSLCLLVSLGSSLFDSMLALLAAATFSMTA